MLQETKTLHHNHHHVAELAPQIVCHNVLVVKINVSSSTLLRHYTTIHLSVKQGELKSIWLHLSPGSSCGLLADASTRHCYNYAHFCGWWHARSF